MQKIEARGHYREDMEKLLHSNGFNLFRQKSGAIQVFTLFTRQNFTTIIRAKSTILVTGNNTLGILLHPPANSFMTEKIESQ